MRLTAASARDVISGQRSCRTTKATPSKKKAQLLLFQ